MPDFGLLQTPNFAQAALGGYQAGRQIGQQRRMDQALQLYAKDPEAGVSAISSIDPGKGEELRKVAQDRRSAEAASKVFQPAPGFAAPGQAAGGLQINQDALHAYAQIDPEGAVKFQEFASKASDAQFKQVQGHLIAKGQAADYLLKIPEGPERTAEYQRMLPQLQSMGFRPEDLAQADLSTRMLSRDALAGHTFGEQTAMQKDYGFLNSVRPGLGDTYLESKASPLIPVKGVDAEGNETLTFMQRPSASDGVAAPTSNGSGSSAGVAPVAHGKAVIEGIFPGVHVTDNVRDPNSALGRANPGSWHNRSEGAVDVRPIPGMTFDQYTAAIEAKGYPIIEKRDEVTNPSGHATGPHWHVVIGKPRTQGTLSANIARPASKQAFDALPSGTQFVAPDGSHRVKP